MHERSERIERNEEQAVTPAVNREGLLKQIRLQVPGGARDLMVEIRAESRTVTLAGLVGSFYAKQVIYHVCGKWAPGFRVVDGSVVGARSQAQSA